MKELPDFKVSTFDVLFGGIKLTLRKPKLVDMEKFADYFSDTKLKSSEMCIKLIAHLMYGYDRTQEDLEKYLLESVQFDSIKDMQDQMTDVLNRIQEGDKKKVKIPIKN